MIKLNMCKPTFFIFIYFYKELKDNQEVSSEYLAKELDIPQSAVKQKMSFWVHQKVIKEHKQLSRINRENSTSLRKMTSDQNLLNLNNDENEATFYYISKTIDLEAAERENIGLDDVDNSMILKDNALSNFETAQFNFVIIKKYILINYIINNMVLFTKY